MTIQYAYIDQMNFFKFYGGKSLEISSGDKKRLTEQIGIGYVLARAGELGYLIRMEKEHDKGIDAHMEIAHSVPLPSKILGLQIKSRSDCYINKNDELTINVTERNLNFWRDKYGRPAIMMVYNHETKEIYWNRIDNAVSTSIKINTENKFDEESLEKLSKIITQYNVDKSLGIKLVTIDETLGDFGENTVSNLLGSLKCKTLEAHALVENGEYYLASEIFKALALLHDLYSFWFNFGFCLFMNGQYDECIAQLITKENQFKDFWQLKNLLAHCYSIKGDYEKAELCLYQAKAIDPKNSLLWNNLGLILYRQGKDLDAYRELKGALDLDENDPHILFNLALSATALEEYNEAIKYYSDCILAEPNFYDAYNNKGLLLKHLWCFEEALKCFQVATEVDPNNHYALVNGAFLMKDLGRDGDAIEYFLLALEAGGDNLEIFRALALLYCRAGQISESEDYFNKCSEVFIREKMPEHEIVISDIGYEVAYCIKLSIQQQIIKVREVTPMNELAPLNDNNPLCKLFKFQQEMGIPDKSMKNQIAKMVDREKRM